MIVKVLRPVNYGEVRCEIISGNPDQFKYPDQLSIDIAVSQLTEEPYENLVGRTFDIGAQWTVYTIIARQFQELDSETLQPILESSPKALATELEPQEMLVQASDRIISDWSSIPLDEIERKRQELAQEFEADSDSSVVNNRLYSWIEDELEKRGIRG